MRHTRWLPAVAGMLSVVAMAFPARAQTSPSPYAARTGAEFVFACKSDPAGCNGKIANVLMSRVEDSGATHVCLPGPSYADAVAPWMNAHPETQNMPAEAAIILALSSLYKCGPPNNY